MRSAVSNPLRFVYLSAVAFLFMPAALSRACSTCFGDPDSSLTKGALAGVIVLGIVIYGVLFSFVGIMFSWRRRARELNGASDGAPQAEKPPL